MDKINELSFKRLECISKIMDERTELHELLNNSRILISKAKTLHGIILSNVVQADTHDLMPTSHVDVSNDETPVFKFLDDLEEQTSDEKEEEKVRQRKTASSSNGKDNKKEDEENDKAKKPVPVSSFRPFGVLEPASAKEARKVMRRALDIICQVATSQAELVQLETQMELQKSNIEKSTEIADILKTLKV